jgi:hypothetical protein
LPSDSDIQSVKDQPTPVLANGWLPVGVWILAAVVAFSIARPGTSLVSTYALTWFAVGAVLVAGVGRRHPWAAMLAAALGGIGGLYFAIDYVVQATIYGNHFGWLYVAGGLGVAALSVVQLVGGIRRLRPIDPIYLAAIQLAIGLFVRWAYYGISGLGLNPNTYPAEDWGTPFRAEIPLLALGLAAVGLGVSRGWRPTLSRLGITRPAWWHVLLALSMSAALVLTVQWFDLLTYRLTPQAYYDIGAIDQRDAAAGLGIGLVYALLAGISEETLFRGAVQARFGILTTALLFAMIHIQFGVTMILAYVLMNGLAYGLLRRYLNTTTAITAHTASDLMGVVGLSQRGVTLILLLTLLVLTPLLFRSRREVFRTLQRGLAEDWSGLWTASSSGSDEAVDSETGSESSSRS